MWGFDFAHGGEQQEGFLRVSSWHSGACPAALANRIQITGSDDFFCLAAPGREKDAGKKVSTTPLQAYKLFWRCAGTVQRQYKGDLPSFCLGYYLICWSDGGKNVIVAVLSLCGEMRAPLCPLPLDLSFQILNSLFFFHRFFPPAGGRRFIKRKEQIVFHCKVTCHLQKKKKKSKRKPSSTAGV